MRSISDVWLSVRKCAKKIGIAPYSVSRLKARYKKYGTAIFIHGNTGRAPKNKQFDSAKIAADYENFRGTNFAAFRDDCADYLHYEKIPSYSTVYNALSGAGIVSPEARIPVREKKKHLPRKERPNEGDLIQIDGSSHDWFMNGHKITLHGAVDDATHKVVALYFCENECLLGYYQLLQQIFIGTGGRLLCDIYSDRYSPQAKGRIERLWRTLQGRLPFIFRFLEIDTIEKANEFLGDFINGFNARFAVAAQDSALHWKAPPHNPDFDFLFSVRADKKTRTDGSFVYHGYKFNLCAPRSACVRFVLCLSESFGIKALMNGKYYDVELAEPITDCVGDSMPIVEKDLIYRYFYADRHSGRATIRAG